ncbi:hydroxyacid dehydrogenase [Streptomyces sp. N35]|uniref:hydroxyacid dehydrogenase n=1 Tax=Streptomyces sp. N35 TaxID=2795730 RepID=UPI0018F34B32|nr:hydroxyacid dehydrogenase [Streptomyces sp. N35]
MTAEEAATVLPQDLRERMVRLADVLGDGVPLSGDLTAGAAREVLAEAEVLVSCWGCPPLTEEVLEGAPRLQAVLHAAGSVKRVATPAVWRRGLLVSSAADANAGPVVDYTLAVILLAGKQALPAARAYRTAFLTHSEREGVDGRTIGIIGASRIGRGVIEGLVAAGRGHRILLHDPYVDEAAARELGAEPADLDTLCRESSIVSVHAPELPETRHLLDARRLALMADGSTLINTARGSLVDTEALTRECVSGRLSAYLDVTDPEPLPSGHPLYDLPNVLLTPHIAGVQGAEVRRLGAYVVAELERYAKGEPLRGRVTEEELGRLA